MRTEQQLRDALSSLAERGPAAEDVLDRLQLPRSAEVSVGHRRRILLTFVIGLTLVGVAAVVLPYLRSRPLPEPADRRVPGNWAMVSEFEPPAEWTLVSRQVAGGFEVTTAEDPSHKAGCSVAVNGRGVTQQMPIPSSTQAATVQGRPALYTATPKRDAAVYWQYGADAWASVECWLGPRGLGSADSPTAIRDLVLRLAESVTFGTHSLLLPIGIERLPNGYAVESAVQDMSSPERWQVTLKPAEDTATTPVIQLHSADGDIPEPNTRIGDYPASFFTLPVRGPFRPVRRPEVSYTQLCVPTASVGICLSADNTATDDPESRRELFHSVADQITYASSPTDTTTWFDADDALPS